MNDDDILVEFIVEAREILDQLDLDFVQLEITPDDQKLVGNIFRAMHTLKGSSGFFAFKRLEKVSHAGESLLGKIRDGQLTLDTQKATILLSTLDCLRAIIEGIESTHTEPAGDDSGLVENLLALAAGKETNVPIQPTTPAEPQAEAISAPENTAHAVSPEPPTPPANSSVVISADDSESTDQVWAPDPADIIKAQETAAPVKVSLELLDKLMNLVSEMVLARNRLLPFTTQFSDHDFSSAVRVVDLLTLELQERMMKTRMQPIAQVWTKFPRLMRDVSNQCGKQVSLIQEGSETELDRTLLDAIRDPLVHIIRNSIDHGIELPEERISRGKPVLGKVLLRASHENGMVVIEIADDGAGVDFDLVRQRAIEKNLIPLQQAQELTDMQLLEFIFLPGFSTKSQVTNLSGRGVGMDVVKTNISNIGGSIDINSKRGVGTNIRLKIPLTLAIMPALFVRCGSEPYAIPQNSVLEMVRLDLSEATTGLEDFYGTPVFRLRNQLVPILFLNHQLEVSQDLPAADAILNIAILQSSGIRFGLVVDEVLKMQEVVVKPLGPLLKDVKDFAGATILGNGRVALILDIDGIAIQSGMVAKIQSRPLNAESIQEKSSEEDVAMLSFELEGQSRLAIYLENVQRLEMISPKQVQRNGNRDVIQYGKEIMHLLYLNQYIEGANHRKTPSIEDEVIPVIVHYTNGIPVGLVVSQVHDIIHVSKNLHEANPPQKGLLGCVSLNDQVINVIDLQEILIMRNLQENSKEYPAVIDMDFS
jgi:two-component system chemotaxis sensor kinase CheA